MARHLSPVERQSILDLILQAYPKPPPFRVIAEVHGCSVSTVSRINREFGKSNRKVLANYAAFTEEQDDKHENGNLKPPRTPPGDA